ncbi:MAG TPA: hypothetical protein VG184_08045 [Acidimicrobiales bacterium]|jgi:uncharacterized protein YjbJ (UPF0337 family)|nr:hypothetical protein [Acidimicrobiales bacterium]
MRIGTIDLDKLRGVGDKILGLAKETVGVVVGNDRWQSEGESQQAKATETLKALRKEADAQAKESKADALGAKTGQRGRSGVFGEAKGKVKSTTGSVIGNPDLQREGDEEAAKGGTEREATEARAEAKAHQTKAKADEASQNRAAARK